MTKHKVVRKRLEIAKRRLKVSESLLGDGFYNESLSGSYYAIFAATKSLLASRDLDAKRHSGVIALFNKHFIKTEQLPKELSKTIAKARTARESSDYEDFYEATKEEADNQLQKAILFVQEVEKFLEELGYETKEG